MRFDEYQKLAARTINRELTPSEKCLHALHLMAAECGEIHGLFQKAYQGHDFEDFHLMKEVGDLLWGMAELCEVFGWSLGDVAEMNIEKLKARYPAGFEAERSLHREKGDI